MIDIETLNALIESIGIGAKLRMFLVDYTDNSGKEYNKKACNRATDCRQTPHEFFTP